MVLYSARRTYQAAVLLVESEIALRLVKEARRVFSVYVVKGYFKLFDIRYV